MSLIIRECHTDSPLLKAALISSTAHPFRLQYLDLISVQLFFKPLWTSIRHSRKIRHGLLRMRSSYFMALTPVSIYIEISQLKMVGESGQDGQFKSGNYVSGANRFWPALFKFIELALAIICIGLIDDPANNSRIRIFVTQRTIMLAYTTFGGFIIICGVYLVAKLFRDTMSWKISSLLSFVATILFIACAAAILRDWSDTKSRNYWPPNAMRMDLLCAAGGVSIVTALVFLIDMIATVRQGARGYIE